ncbi:ACP S-malonyltransferase [Streptomyces zhihengii]
MRCYVFPGQGTQKKGMGRSLFARFPDLLRRADQVLGYPVEELCRDNPDRRLSETAYAQPAIYVVNALHWSAAQEDLPPADFLAGHSLGEYSALFAAGAFDFETGLTLVQRRAELMGQISGGGMAAVVGLPEQVVEEILKRHDAAGVVIANYNAPEQVVLSGSHQELARIKPFFEKAEGVRASSPSGSAAPSTRRRWPRPPPASATCWPRSTWPHCGPRSSPTSPAARSAPTPRTSATCSPTRSPSPSAGPTASATC